MAEPQLTRTCSPFHTSHSPAVVVQRAHLFPMCLSKVATVF